MNEIDYHNMEESAALAKCHEELLAVLKEYDTGRWDWDQIDCCFTGKDADLEPWGQQGISVIQITDDTVKFRVHGGKTFAGIDVSLNFPEGKGDDDDYYSKALDIWAEQATMVVQGCDSDGEWTGDDWWMSFEEDAEVEWQFDEKGEMSYDLTAKAMIQKAHEIIQPWEKEIMLADGFMDQLAGWRDAEGNPLPEGKPDMDLSVFNFAYWEDQE